MLMFSLLLLLLGVAGNVATVDVIGGQVGQRTAPPLTDGPRELPPRQAPFAGGICAMAGTGAGAPGAATTATGAHFAEIAHRRSWQRVSLSHRACLAVAFLGEGVMHVSRRRSNAISNVSIPAALSPAIPSVALSFAFWCTGEVLFERCVEFSDPCRVGPSIVTVQVTS